ncbi:class I SAM-dependent methyltransferase [Legionella dresdenensis]|uniref:Class I SAM-dependent methyltransferase n=1 Tax=Legionella dresdenensis TaxID=450200 RepID=A0ABV8CDA0_9GAMM
MKKCFNCSAVFLTSIESCISCGTNTDIIDGFPAYSPVAIEGVGFKSEYFTTLAALEEENFWFKVRNKLIIYLIRKYCPDFKSFLEVGCGTGYVLSGIANAFPGREMSGSELFTAGLGHAASRVPFAKFMQMDARNMPFIEEFDCLGSFDVLEHIEEDETVLKQMHTALKPSGTLIITVPQHNWLWSPVDDYSCHVRRYSANELHQKIRQAGFKIIRSTSFVSLLLPAMLASRLKQKYFPSATSEPGSELKIPGWLNQLLEKILDFELIALKAGINFVCGGSRVVVARKII